jgi:DNA-directed RNA polymerase sigma subunit (sigma70/sigma32)
LKDYRVELKVKNNLLASAMERKGIASAAELARQSGINQTYIGKYLNLQESIYDFRGEYRPQFMRLCEFFNLMPDELYPEAQMSEPLKTNKKTIEADAHELVRLEADALDPAKIIELGSRREAIRGMLFSLTKRESDVVSLRLGFEGVEHTWEEIGNVYGVSKERVRQIYGKALRKLRHPERLKYAGLDQYGRVLESE